ncbi:MAG TPA: nuclear transport factor 2 family protein [Mucilaginibacter sp.]|jgi:ketosteroid isomerase-like protein|nr:nuclear transport factor 2 family protein [Mucilaginibacter sp.]
MSTQVETMSTQDVANRLVLLCREGKNVEAINELYDEDIVSHEPEGSPMKEKVGKQAVLDATNQWFQSVKELHSSYVSNPIVAGNFFACTMKVDATYKEHGRNVMDELCVFEVEDGKIVSEQFFYETGH